MLADKHGIEAFFHQLLAGPSNGVDAGIEGGGDLAVPPGGKQAALSAGLFVRRTSCHSKCQSAPRASATQGNHADETSPRCSMGCRGWGERGATTLSHLETDFPDAQVTDFAGGFFVPFLTLCRLFRV